ncbi:MAG: hypothetical protein JOZ77_07465 [Candidatus Eremiobacteraeota bacterium]|nr:hypothetical protein [Candidatus Eremiobacteraeota bacterium]
MAETDEDVSGAAIAIRYCSALIGAIIAFEALPAAAAVMRGHVWEATYVAAYQPTFGVQGVPHSGVMKLRFNDGIIAGTYVSQSVRPDPLYGRTIAISGNVSAGNITLVFQTSGGFTVRGTIAENGEISGTATIRGSFYNFLAKVKSSP